MNKEAHTTDKQNTQPNAPRSITEPMNFGFDPLGQHAAVERERQRLRDAVNERKKVKLVTVNDKNRMDCLRDCAFGNVEACEWFLSLLEESKKSRQGKRSEAMNDKQKAQDKLIEDFMEKAHGDQGGPYDTWDKMISVVHKIRGLNHGIANGPQLYRLVEMAMLRLDLSEVINSCLKFIIVYEEYRKKHPKLFKP